MAGISFGRTHSQSFLQKGKIVFEKFGFGLRKFLNLLAYFNLRVEIFSEFVGLSLFLSSPSFPSITSADFCSVLVYFAALFCYGEWIGFVFGDLVWGVWFPY